jgi:RNA polymerase-binding transcription factor DksA
LDFDDESCSQCADYRRVFGAVFRLEFGSNSLLRGKMFALIYPASFFPDLEGAGLFCLISMPKSKPPKAAAKNSKPPRKKAAAKPAKTVKSARKVKPANSRANSNAHAKVNGKKKEAPNQPSKVNSVRPRAGSNAKLSPFLRKQKERLVQLRDSMLDSMMGVAKDTLRSRAEGSEASAFGMHQADAGSDAYDRDFALSLLSQEQDALYEIEEAIKRIDAGTYGTCEMSGKPIAHARLEAIPFARYTVECQSQLEKQNKHFNVRKPVTSLFGLTDEEPGEAEEEEATPETNKE